MAPNDAPCRDRRLRRVIQHIIQDLTRQPRMAELASLAGLERTYFCRHFHRTVGVKFSIWSRNVRAERAKELLANTDLPITTIATAVGYVDVTTFERNFRRCQHCSPRQYRQSQRQAEGATSQELPITPQQPPTTRQQMPTHRDARRLASAGSRVSDSRRVTNDRQQTRSSGLFDSRAYQRDHYRFSRCMRRCALSSCLHLLCQNVQ